VLLPVPPLPERTAITVLIGAPPNYNKIVYSK